MLKMQCKFLDNIQETQRLLVKRGAKQIEDKGWREIFHCIYTFILGF